MNDKTIPNVLILSTNFSSGDAITSINLFSKWHKDNLFCASLFFNDYCRFFKSYYHIGNKEIKYMPPFNLFRKPQETNILYDCEYNEKKNERTKHTRLKWGKCNSYIQYIMLCLNPLSIHMRIRPSTLFCNWINEIKPDFIYTSVGNYAMAVFICKLMILFPNIKFIIHGYDDWIDPSYALFFKKRFRSKANLMLKNIINGSTILLSTSQKMSNDYFLRYGKSFTVFPNPVQVEEKHDIIEKHNNVLFIGKIGRHNSDSILKMAEAIKAVNDKYEYELFFEIYSPIDKSIEKSLFCKLDKVLIHSWVAHDQIPNLLRKSKILYLPITNRKRVKKFVKYSMSTKMSEYLASGSPVIYVGPKGIAMTELLEENNCAFCVTDNKIKSIENAIVQIFNDPILVEEYRIKAKKLVYDRFDISVVSENFKDLICSYKV